MIIEGDCLEVMKTFPDNHFSGIVTDPPYGLGFMGKRWDHEVPQVLVWKEAFRISKPGSFLISMGGTRTFHRLACAIEDAGFEIRDCISWLYGSGFPKSHNRFGIEGFGTALKPAWEPCIVAMKPLDGTFKQNADKWGVGGLNIDACRIQSPQMPSCTSNPNIRNGKYNSEYEGRDVDSYMPHTKGRWPANLILDEGVFQEMGKKSRYFYCAKASSGERNEGLNALPDKVGGGMCSTVSGDSRTGHITIQKNNHPTVKPVALMRYLITLISPPTNALILDPFAGSGTTVLAAHQLGIKCIGIEKQPEYAEIARKRIENAAQETN